MYENIHGWEGRFLGRFCFCPKRTTHGRLCPLSSYSHSEHGIQAGAGVSVQQSQNNRLKDEKQPCGWPKGRKEPGFLMTIWATEPKLGLPASDLLTKQYSALWLKSLLIFLAQNIKTKYTHNSTQRLPFLKS